MAVPLEPPERPLSVPDSPALAPPHQQRPTRQRARCPDCGAGLIRQSGCLVCVQCGWARCS